MKPRIYIDTSVIGGYFDKEFEEETKKLFKRLKKGEVIFVLSDLLEAELATAPEKVRELLERHVKQYADQIEFVKNTTEAETLARKYIDEKVVGVTSFVDCNHIAIATICRAYVLASWNFRHIVNLQRIQGYNGVNLKHGYATLEIRTPKDLVEHENDKCRNKF